MSEIILGAVLIIVAAALAEEAPPGWRKVLWAFFTMCVLTQAVLQARSRLADQKEVAEEKRKSQELATDVNETKQKLDISLHQQDRMRGHLEAIESVMNDFGKFGLPEMKEVAKAITKIAAAGREPNNQSLELLPAVELRVRVINAADHLLQRAQPILDTYSRLNAQKRYIPKFTVEDQVEQIRVNWDNDPDTQQECAQLNTYYGILLTKVGQKVNVVNCSLDYQLIHRLVEAKDKATGITH